MYEINGFKVEKFNQYGLDEKAKYSTCPLCSSTRKKSSEKCATLHWDKGLGVCHHCGESFQLHTYKRKAEEVKREYTRPEWKNNTTLSDKVVKWFETERKISQFTLRMLKVTDGIESMPIKGGTWENRNAIQFNYFRNGELINIKYRDAQKNFKMVKNAEKIFYNLDSCHISDEVLIVEGEIDVLSFYECGIHNVVSIPNGSTKHNTNLEYLDNCIEYFENKKKIYLALDTDEAGMATRKEMIRRFGAERCYIIEFDDCKDANEHLIKHGKDSLIGCYETAKAVPLEGASSVMNWEDKFDNYLLHGYSSGYKTGIESFDKIFSTYTGQYIVVTGIPSSGKSDFADMMALSYNRMYGWKTAYASPENKPNEIHAGKMAAKITGEWISKPEQVYSEWFKACKYFMDDNYKYIDLDKYDLESVLNKTRELILRYGIKCLVLDPYNKIKLLSSINKNVNDYTNDYLLMIDEFARKHDILIILVAHPRKPSVGETKNYEPDFYDIKGGGEFYDMSPHGLLVHRDYENDLIKVKVLKVKFAHLGENNKFVWLKWNKKSGRFQDFTMQSDDPNQLGTLIQDNTNWLHIEGVPLQPETYRQLSTFEDEKPF